MAMKLCELHFLYAYGWNVGGTLGKCYCKRSCNGKWNYLADLHMVFDSLSVEGNIDKLMVLLVMQWLNYMALELCYGVSHAMGF